MEKFDEIILKERERKLFISRLPKNVKEEFINFANEEFCGDYGMCFRDIFSDAKLFRKIKEMFMLNKLKLVFEK